MVEVKPKLRKILKDRDLTQVEFSELTGIPQGTISRFDGNSRHEDHHLFAIARALNLKVEDLFDVIEKDEISL